MTEFFVDKNIITTKIVKLLNPDYNQADLQHARKSWWYNIRRDGGLGLSHRGKQAFDLANIEYWDLPINIAYVTKASTKLKLDQYFPSPYYIFFDNKKPKATPYIRVYDGRIASMIALYGGFSLYLDSLHTKRTEMYSKEIRT